MLILVGCNHRSAPVAFRERLAFSSEQVPEALERLRTLEGVEEALLLSTCNRTEVLAWTARGEREGIDAVKGFLREARGVAVDELERHVYGHAGLDAVRHVLRVAAGLDSMILGEPQILGQVKQAYLAAKARGTTGVVLERLMQQCLGASKRIRNETGISRNPVSVAFAAVHLARQIFGDLSGRRALLVGSGKMTRLVARHLQSHGVSELSVTSRTYDHAAALAAQCAGRAVHWAEGLGRLSEVDIVVTCTAAPETILNREQVARASRLRRGEPLFIIDLAVPRDVEPEVNALDNVYLYDIDGLQAVVDAGLEQRQRAAQAAERLIGGEIAAFDRWRQSLEIGPTIALLSETVLGTARREVQRIAGRLGARPLDAQAAEELARALARKLLHHPVTHLRRSTERGDVGASAALYRQIFGLGEREPPQEDEPPSTEESGPRRVLKGGKDL